MANTLTEIRRTTALAEYLLSLTTQIGIEEAEAALKEYMTDKEFVYLVLSNIVAAIRETLTDFPQVVERFNRVLTAFDLVDSADNIPVNAMTYFEEATKALSATPIVNAYTAFVESGATDDWEAIAFSVRADVLDKLLSWRAISKHMDVVTNLIEALNSYSDEDITTFDSYDLSFLRNAHD